MSQPTSERLLSGSLETSRTGIDEMRQPTSENLQLQQRVYQDGLSEELPGTGNDNTSIMPTTGEFPKQNLVMSEDRMIASQTDDEKLSTSEKPLSHPRAVIKQKLNDKIMNRGDIAQPLLFKGICMTKNSIKSVMTASLPDAIYDKQREHINPMNI